MCRFNIIQVTGLYIDHFTVVCAVTWPLDGSEAGVDLVDDTDLTDFVM